MNVFYAIISVSAFLQQYIMLTVHWCSEDSHDQVYLPQGHILVPIALIVYDMIKKGEPFLAAAMHRLPYLLLILLALSGAWVIGYHKLKSSGEWDEGIS